MKYALCFFVLAFLVPLISCNKVDPKSDSLKAIQKKADEYRKSRTEKLEAEKHRLFLEEEAKWEFFWGGPLTPLVEKDISKDFLEKMKNRGCDVERIQKAKFPEKWNVYWHIFPNASFEISSIGDIVRFKTSDSIDFSSPTFPFGDDEYEIVASFQGAGLVRLGYALIDGDYDNQAFIEYINVFAQKNRFVQKIENPQKHKKFYLYFHLDKKLDIQCFDITIRKKKKNVSVQEK